MKGEYSLPFRTAVEGNCELSPWHYRASNGDFLRLEDSIPNWDYLRPLDLVRRASISGEALFTTCGLDSTSRVQLVVSVHCPASRFREVVFRSSILESASVDIEIQFSVAGEQLADRAEVETEIILLQPSGKRSQFVAHLRGSRLYAESCTVELEGTGSRMPTELLSFSERLAWLSSPRAPWYVECRDADLRAPVMREVRVFINEDESAFADSAVKGNPIVVSLIGADIARRILLSALSDDDFLSAHEDYPTGSIGEVAKHLVGLCFPVHSPIEVRTLAQDRPAHFDAMILSALNVTSHE
jgi:hypothetical protein